MRGAGAARGLPVVDSCLIDIFHSDTILPPSLPLVLCDQLGLLAITIFPLHPYILYSTSLIGSKRVFITNVKGTFLGMSESEEASKRR